MKRMIKKEKKERERKEIKYYKSFLKYDNN